jgi:N-acetylglucosaminyldiphosphoundecaprenol N-acetyl-beta-D-mannosaminyltransferase
LVETVDVAGIKLDDLSFEGTLSRLEAALFGCRRYTAFALHVGGLLHLNDADYVSAFNAADCRYADGVASVLLARLAGARRVERAPTTDLAPALLATDSTGQPLRVALIGGPAGLADRAAVAITTKFAARVVYATHGFHDSWEAPLDDLRASTPQLLLVGMGMPREAKWVAEHADALPPCLILTCGGWFGFVTGAERRAPAWMQKAGLEWVARLYQSPGRLFERYARGALKTLQLATTIVLRRA